MDAATEREMLPSVGPISVELIRRGKRARVAIRSAQQQRDEYVHKVAELEREQRDAAVLREWRAQVKAGDTVWVPKYDKHGRVVRIDGKRGAAVVSLGLGQWEVTFDEIYPEIRVDSH